MKMARFLFPLGIAMQVAGFILVGLCLFSGLRNGDYGQTELAQLIGGSTVFYIGVLVKNITQKS
jgi:hypothetical protein